MGNDSYFTILVIDAGYVMKSRTQPTQVNSNKTLKIVCEEEHCVLLHTSDKYHTYQLSRNSNGKIIKTDREDENLTVIENTIKFTRLLRKQQEQIHASLKSIFQITDAKKLSNHYLLPFSNQERRRFHLTDEYSNVPKLTLIAIASCSLLNSPGT